MHEPYCNTSRLNLPKLAKILHSTNHLGEFDEPASWMHGLWCVQAKIQLSLREFDWEAVTGNAILLIAGCLSCLEHMRPGQWDWTRSTNRNREEKKDKVDPLRISHYLIMASDYFDQDNLKDASISIELAMLETFRLCDRASLPIDESLELFTQELLHNLEAKDTL